jgi:hypothetical protein
VGEVAHAQHSGRVALRQCRSVRSHRGDGAARVRLLHGAAGEQPRHADTTARRRCGRHGTVPEARRHLQTPERNR